MAVYYEIEVDPIRRDRRLARPVALYLDDVERRFLLVRLGDLAGVTEAITHRLRPGEHVAAWDRSKVLACAAALVVVLRRDDVEKPLLVYSQINRRLLREAVEGNTFFTRLDVEHPVRGAHAVRRIDVLRRKISAAIGVPVARPRIMRPGAG